MRFAHPSWLAVGLVACLMLVALWRLADARQHAALARFVSAHLRHALTRSLSAAKRRWQRGLYLAALALACVALAGPQWGYRWEVINRLGNEIIFAVDTSRSMSTPDIKPNRLERAKLAIDDFVNQLDGDAVGIVAFAGDAFLVCPMTLDYGAFHESLSALDTATIPRGGTNISSAIHEAQAALRRRPGSDKILILVTDGEDLEGSALTAAQAAKQQDGLVIYTVGVGTTAGDLIPLPADQGGGFVKDESGAFVKSHLDEAGLKAIAGATGGFYVPLGAQGEGLDTIYKTALGSLAKHRLASRQQKIYTERYQWPLAGSLGALLLSLLVGSRRRMHAPRPSAARKAAPATAALVLGVALCPALLAVYSPRARAASETAGGTDQPVIEYNKGTAAYRAGQFPQAAQAFQQSISNALSSDAKRLADQEDAYYNLGNTLYRTGQASEKSAPKDTLKNWTDAVKAYETALQLRPGDADSKYNRDLVKRKIAALQQQEDKKPPPQNGGGGGGGGKPQDQGGQGQDQKQANNQGQPRQNQPPQGQGQQPNQAQQGQQQRQGQPQGQPQSPQGQPQQANNKAQQQKSPQPSPQPGQPNHEPGQGDAQPREADQREPGEMSREEARELLDSVKDEERHQPLVPLARAAEQHDQEQPTKNW